MSENLTNAHEFTVTDIANAVKRTVEDEFGHVRVRGEISGFRGQHSSGHAYFTLKDEGASIDAVIWKGSYSRLAFKPEEGLEVIATGKLTTFPRSSKYQIVIENIEPAGAGALMALLEDRRKKFLAEGLFSPERKKALPYLPRIIGVITSPTGAVIRDILHRLDDRFPTHVILWPVRVQGDTCAAEVSAAIRGFNSFSATSSIPRPDLLIVARGGGSIEDLWGFNEEAVVRAVSDSEIPVISAVGHETDTTLIDYVSDRRAPTPTGAAEMAVPVRADLIGYVDDLGARQRHALRRQLSNQKDRLRAASAGLPRAQDLTNTQRQRLDIASTKLNSALQTAYHAKNTQFSRISYNLNLTTLHRKVESAGSMLESAQTRLKNAMRQRHSLCVLRFAPIAQAFRPQLLQTQIGLARQRVSISATRLPPAITRSIADSAKKLSLQAQLLNTLSYHQVLSRGFALITNADGVILRSASDAQAGDLINVELADGKISAHVIDDGDETHGLILPEPKLVTPKVVKRKPKSNTPTDTGQESLF